jgi:hypothetical protein
LLWNDKSQLTAAVANVEQENEALQGRIASLDAERTRLESRVSALEKERQDLQIRVASLEERDPLREIQPITLAAQPGAPVAEKVMALWDPYRREGSLHAKLPKPAPDKDYQLWIITPESKQPVDAGVIPAVSDNKMFTASRPVTQVAALAISIEPKGGSPAPQGPVIYLGKF